MRGEIHVVLLTVRDAISFPRTVLTLLWLIVVPKAPNLDTTSDPGHQPEHAISMTNQVEQSTRRVRGGVQVGVGMRNGRETEVDNDVEVAVPIRGEPAGPRVLGAVASRAMNVTEPAQVVVKRLRKVPQRKPRIEVLAAESVRDMRVCVQRGQSTGTV